MARRTRKLSPEVMPLEGKLLLSSVAPSPKPEVSIMALARRGPRFLLQGTVQGGYAINPEGAILLAPVSASLGRAGQAQGYGVLQVNLQTLSGQGTLVLTGARNSTMIVNLQGGLDPSGQLTILMNVTQATRRYARAVGTYALGHASFTPSAPGTGQFVLPFTPFS